MMEFVKYLDGIKVKLGIKSDREFAYKIGISPAYYSNIKLGQIPDDDICIKFAELAGDDPEKVLLLAHKSKASEKSKKYWDKLLKAVNVTAILLITLQLLSASRYIM